MTQLAQLTQLVVNSFEISKLACVWSWNLIDTEVTQLTQCRDTWPAGDTGQ